MLFLDLLIETSLFHGVFQDMFGLRTEVVFKNEIDTSGTNLIV